jgi:hypothetical protein
MRISSSRSGCATSGGHGAWRRDCRLRDQFAKQRPKTTGSGRRSGRNTRSMSGLWFTGGYARGRIAVAIGAGQNRLFGWAGEPWPESVRQTAADCVTLTVSPLGPVLRSKGRVDGVQAAGTLTSRKGWSPASRANPPRDGRGHRRRVGTAATPAIRTDVDPVAGAPAPASSLSSCSSCRLPPPAMTLGPPSPMTPLPPIHARGACRAPAPTSRARGARRAPAPGSGPHRPTGSGPPRAAVWPRYRCRLPGAGLPPTYRSDGDENFYIIPNLIESWLGNVAAVVVFKAVALHTRDHAA